jgi:hypothetical protein
MGWTPFNMKIDGFSKFQLLLNGNVFFCRSFSNLTMFDQIQGYGVVFSLFYK